MYMWRIAANPKGVFFSSLRASICLFILSELPSLVCAKEWGCSNMHCHHSWERPLVKKHLHLCPGCAGVTPQPRRVAGTPQPWLLSQPPRGHAGRECRAGGRVPGHLPAGRLTGPALEGAPAWKWAWERSEAVRAQLGGQPHTSHVPYLCKRCCNGNSYLGSNRPNV